MVFHELREIEYREADFDDAHERAVNDEILYVLKHLGENKLEDYLAFAENYRMIKAEEKLESVEENNVQQIPEKEIRYGDWGTIELTYLGRNVKILLNDEDYSLFVGIFYPWGQEIYDADLKSLKVINYGFERRERGAMPNTPQYDAEIKEHLTKLALDFDGKLIYVENNGYIRDPIEGLPQNVKILFRDPEENLIERTLLEIQS
ncbi:hypothetical protein HYT56_03015 [Candidatus Woesearchaeota archaeon]|nr:hypothetical protein [Candidatus Woesearchaeota archaeon]